MFIVTVKKSGSYESMTFYPEDMPAVISLLNELLSVAGKDKLSFEIEQAEEKSEDKVQEAEEVKNES